MFQDRQEAGQRLGARLTEDGITADIVLGIPRGALPVARPVADVLDVPLDIVVASKIGAPHNPELAIGAVASDGTRWLNDDLIDRLGVDEDYIETEGEREAANAHEKVKQYRTEDDEPDLSDRAVIIVDDGVATGATARACCRTGHRRWRSAGSARSAGRFAGFAPRARLGSRSSDRPSGTPAVPGRRAVL